METLTIQRTLFYNLKKKLTMKNLFNPLMAIQRIAVCNPSCVSDLPDMSWVNACTISTRTGGIPRLTFLKCNDNFVLPYPNGWENIENIKWAINNGQLYVTGDLLGQKPKGSFTKRRLSSCGPETTISGSKTLTFQDFNADTTDLIDFDFWAAVVENKDFLKFGYITCDERWYQYSGDWDIEIDEVIEDTKDGKSFWDGTITMATKDVIVPIMVPGILAALKSITSVPAYA